MSESHAETLAKMFSGQYFVAVVKTRTGNDPLQIKIDFGGKGYDGEQNQLMIGWAHAEPFEDTKRVDAAIRAAGETLGFVVVLNLERSPEIGFRFFDLEGDLPQFNPDEFITCVAYELHGMTK